MAIAFRAQTSLGGTASSISVIKPAGALVGDLLIVDIVTNNATVTGVPSGWTQITNVQTGLAAKLFAYSHVVGASDPGPWSFTLSSSVAYSHICGCYTGVDPTTPLDVAAGTVGSNTAGASVVVPAIAPVSADTMLHSGVGQGATNRKITNPGAATSIVEVVTGRRQEAAWQALTATGTTGTRTWSFSGSAVYNAYMVALRPALVTLLLNLTDLTAFATALDTAIASATGSDLTDLNRIKTALGTPSALPLAASQYQQGDGDIRVLVLSAQNGRKQHVVDLFDRSWQLGGGDQFLRAIMKDTRTSAQDPWGG